MPKTSNHIFLNFSKGCIILVYLSNDSATKYKILYKQKVSATPWLFTWHRIHIIAMCLYYVYFTQTHIHTRVRILGIYEVLIIDLIKNNVNNNSTIVIITKRSDAGSGIRKGSSGWRRRRVHVSNILLLGRRRQRLRVKCV